MAGAGCVCGTFFGSGTIASGAGAGGWASGLPNAKPKSTSLALRVLLRVSVYVVVSRGRGKARTQLRAVAFAAAPLALLMVSSCPMRSPSAVNIQPSIVEERRQEKTRLVVGLKSRGACGRSQGDRGRSIFVPISPRYNWTSILRF